jgi:hypothetical protein
VATLQKEAADTGCCDGTGAVARTKPAGKPEPVAGHHEQGGLILHRQPRIYQLRQHGIDSSMSRNDKQNTNSAQKVYPNKNTSTRMELANRQQKWNTAQILDH